MCCFESLANTFWDIWKEVVKLGGKRSEDNFFLWILTDDVFANQAQRPIFDNIHKTPAKDMRSKNLSTSLFCDVMCCTGYKKLWSVWEVCVHHDMCKHLQKMSNKISSQISSQT